MRLTTWLQRTKGSAAVGRLRNTRLRLVRVSAGVVVPEGSLSALEVEAQRLREISIGCSCSRRPCDALRGSQRDTDGTSISAAELCRSERPHPARPRVGGSRREGADHVRAEQAEHRVRPRAVGRRLVLQQGDPHASGGGARGDLRPERPRHARGRRRRRHPRAGAGQQPGHPRRPLVRRNRHHRRGNRRPRCRAGLHRRTRAGRRRNVAEPAGPVPHHRRLRPHRDRRRAHLAAPGRHRVLRGRPTRAGAAARLGDPGRARRGPVRPEGRRHRVEVEAELVHRGQQRPHRPSRAATLRRRSAWAPPPTRSTAATSPCSRTPTSCST